MIRASVAMAVYNGEKYLKEQVDSILLMMNVDDELIVSYEESSDNSLNILKQYEKQDARVHVFYDNGHSVEKNFNNAVMHCSGKYIFLADQDDVWINSKINVMTDYFELHPDCVVLIGNGYLSDESLNEIGTIFDAFHTTPNPLRNYIKGSYLGCQMAFRSSIKDKVWPVRVSPPVPHDLWLGIQGSRYGNVELLDEKLIKHRLHNNNYSNTSKLSFWNVIKNRLLILSELMKRGKMKC